ncbi:hypothetical protein RclHR1_06750007 [Rhizophagus clarus]|uniref:Transcription factor Hsf1 n=1 Tax=Rhizophagus clarus TaxID=94130 RepID=A0A2Z6RZH1_9GLOM|nr:hypothetical protein RclHR1_06750007 [Rhizophagus clarus]GES92912.1 transcription factor Hsf1 [Rhizophagus clarus]
MYGFHKIPHLQQGVLQPDEQSEQLEFSNPNFLHNQPDLLYCINRKKGKDNNIKESNEVDMNYIINEITSIKKCQMIISEDIRNIQKDNQILYEKYYHQQNTISKILKFLASVFSVDNKRTTIPKKRKFSNLLKSSDVQAYNGADFPSLTLDFNNSAESTPLTVSNNEQFDDSLNLTLTDLSEIDVGSNIDYLTSNEMTNLKDNSIENNILSYYNVDVNNLLEQDNQLIFDFNLDENDNNYNNPNSIDEC